MEIFVLGNFDALKDNTLILLVRRQQFLKPPNASRSKKIRS